MCTVKELIEKLTELPEDMQVEVYIERTNEEDEPFEELDLNNPLHFGVVSNTLFFGDYEDNY